MGAPAVASWLSGPFMRGGAEIVEEEEERDQNSGVKPGLAMRRDGEYGQEEGPFRDDRHSKAVLLVQATFQAQESPPGIHPAHGRGTAPPSCAEVS